MELNGIAAAAIVIVRVFNNYGVPVKDLQAAQTQAQSILQDAGVGVRWIACGEKHREPGQAPPRCRQSIGAGDLMLRLEAGVSVGPVPDASMGFSFVSGTASYLPFLATVFADRVTATARQVGAEPRQLLARAIAHELGHLLLNSTKHAERGLMRSTWSPVELRRNVEADWIFLDREAASIRAASVSRMSGN